MSQPGLRDLLDQVAFEHLGRAARLLAAILAISAPLSATVFPPPAVPFLVPASVLSTLLALAVSREVSRTSPRQAHPIGAGLLALLTANVCIVLAVTGDPRAIAGASIVPVAAGWLFLSRRWWCGTTVAAALALGLTVAWALPVPIPLDVGGAFLLGVLLGGALHETRLAAFRRVGAMRHEGENARRELEVALADARHREDRLRHLTDASTEGVILHDSGRILDANRAAVELLARPLPDLIDRSFSSLFVRESDSKTTALAAIGRPFEATVLLPDGTPLALELRTGTISLDDRLASAVTLRDITTREREREVLEARRALEGLVTRVAAELVKLPPDLLDQGIEQAIEAIARLIGADHGQLTQLGPGGKLRHRCQWTRDGMTRPLAVESTQQQRVTPWISRRTAALEAVHVSDVEALPPQAAMDRSFLQRQGIRSLITIPIARGDRTLGALMLAAIQNVRPWTEETVGLLRIVGEIMASALVRQRALQDLEASEARKAAILEVALDCIITTDATGNVIEFNPAAEKTLGYARRDAVGRSIRDLIIPDRLRRTDEDGLRTLFTTEGGPPLGQRVEILARRSDGVEFPAELAIVPMQIDSESAFTLYLRDITDRREVDRLREELIATVSHELRTPLTSLRGFAELMLERDFSPEKRHKYLTVIRNESVRLTQIVNDFLDLKRLESGRASLQLDRIDIRALLRETEAVFSREDGAHAFHLELDPALALVRCDTAQIRRLLANLVSNAVKFSPNGGNITLGARNEPDGVLIWVRDEGVGIPAEALDGLFQKFHRVDNGATRSIGGTGLGLALVKEIVAAHGGQAAVDSTLGRGSTFYVRLPVAPPEAPAPDESDPSMAVPHEGGRRA